MAVGFFIAPINEVTWTEFYWVSLRGLSEDKEFLEWVEENPMPKNSLYESLEEFLDDCERAEGIITFSRYIEDKFLYWFREVLKRWGVW